MCFKTFDATTAKNQTLRQNTWIDVRQKELRVFIVIKSDIMNVSIEGSEEISEDGEQLE